MLLFNVLNVSVCRFENGVSGVTDSGRSIDRPKSADRPTPVVRSTDWSRSLLEHYTKIGILGKFT